MSCKGICEILVEYICRGLEYVQQQVVVLVMLPYCWQIADYVYT